MNDVHPVPPQCEGQHELILPEGTPFRPEQRAEIGGKLPKFLVALFRPDQQVFVDRVDGSEIPDEIPDIGADPELINLPNVDSDAHGSVQPAIL